MTLFLLLALSAKTADGKALMPIEPAKLERKEPVEYGKEVWPIFQAKCVSCHSGWVPQGSYEISGIESLLKGGKKGVGIVPGKPAESNIYLYLSHAKKPIMPPRSENDELTAMQVALIKRWIEEGAKAPMVEAKKAPRSVVLALPAALVKPVRALAMHPNANVLAVGRSNRVMLLEAKTGEVTAELLDANLKTPDGKPAHAAHVSLVESIAFSPDGAILATGSFREVTLWDTAKKTVLARLDGFADKVTAIAWSPDGKTFATAGGAPTEDGEIRIFSAAGKLLNELKSPHSDTVFGIAYSPDGKRLGSAGADKFVRVFDAASGKLLKSFEGHTQHVLDVGWSPDGLRLVSAGADDLIKIWDIEKGEKTRDLKGSAKQVTRLVFAGKAFFTVGGDAIVRRWSIETGDPSRTFGEAKDYLYAVAANADGSLIAAGGEEGIVRIYDGKTAQLLKAIAFDAKK